MNTFQFKSLHFHNKRILIKILALQLILLYGFANLSAQKESYLKLKVETGLNWKPAEKDINRWGLLFSLEPKLKTSDKTFIGLRIHANENFQFNEKYKSPQFFIDNNISTNLTAATSNTILSFVPTFDYIFIGNNFRPYLGMGVGIYMLTLPFNNPETPSSIGIIETSVNNQLGFLIRGGLELGKITVGLEFNYILEADIKIPSGLIIGTVNDSFIAMSIGYTFDIGNRLE